MRLEIIPVILGALLALVGLALVADAFLEEGVIVSSERRRRERAERSRWGEALVGIGVGCFAIALIGRDLWRWSTVTIITGTSLLVIGAVMNARYLRETVVNRGAARRSSGTLPDASAPLPPSPNRAEPAERRKQPR